MKKILLGLVFAIGLSGCANQTLQTFNPTVAKEIEKSLTVAHVNYNAAGELILEGTKTGQIKGATALQIKVVYDKTGDTLKIADDLNAAGSTSDVLTQVNIVNESINNIKALVK